MALVVEVVGRPAVVDGALGVVVTEAAVFDELAPSSPKAAPMPIRTSRTAAVIAHHVFHHGLPGVSPPPLPIVAVDTGGGGGGGGGGRFDIVKLYRIILLNVDATCTKTLNW